MHRKPGTASSVLNIANGLETHVFTANGQEILLFAYFTVEMCLHLSGYVNNQNRGKDTPLHEQKVGVWCVISRTRIIDPLFFDYAIRWKSYYEVVLYPFMGHLNEDEIARGYTSNS
jgi:hypothetical protein